MESKTVMSDDFTNLLERLALGKVKFVLVGGFACVVHGCTYVTQDIDRCCDFSVDNLMALQEILSDLQPVHSMTPKRQKLKLTEKTCCDFKNLYLDTKIGQLDCLSLIDGVGDYNQVKKASRTMKLDKVKISVLSIDALIKAKKALNRPRDRLAIMQLEALKKLQKEK
jgi:hypothetical protein